MLGATAKAGTILNVLAWPLGFFAAGLICALLLALAFAIMFRGLLTEWVPAYMLQVDRHLNRFTALIMLAMVVCFILGCILGIGIVAFASPVTPAG